MLQKTCDVKTTWVQIQRSPRSMLPYGVTGQPWVNVRLKNFLSKNSALSVIINNSVIIFALITYPSACSCESRSRDLGFHTKLDVSWDFSAAISHRIKTSAIGLPRLVKTVTWHRFSNCPLICALTQRLGGTVYIFGNVRIILYAWRCIVQCLSKVLRYRNYNTGSRRYLCENDQSKEEIIGIGYNWKI